MSNNERYESDYLTDDLNQSDREAFELEEAQRANDLKAVLQTLEGKRFIASVLADCGIYRKSFTGNSQTFFNEGVRSVGLRLIDRIEELEGNQFLELINSTYKKETQ